MRGARRDRPSGLTMQDDRNDVGSTAPARLQRTPDGLAIDPNRAWQRMLSGRRLDLLDPSPLDIEIEDIAHGLARVARWNGQTKGESIFSVAQHCVLVADIADALAPSLDMATRLMVLLHDAPEYVVGDMISPFKAVIGPSYKAVERRLLAAIHLRFGLPAAAPEAVACRRQAGRPHRRLHRGDRARRLHDRGGPALLRRPAAAGHCAGSRSSAGRGGEGGFSHPLCRTDGLGAAHAHPCLPLVAARGDRRRHRRPPHRHADQCRDGGGSAGGDRRGRPSPARRQRHCGADGWPCRARRGACRPADRLRRRHGTARRRS